MMRILIGMAMALTPVAAFAAEPAKPLFASNDTIRFTITGPISMIANKAEQSEAPQPATLTLAGRAETHPIMLSARGITRRKNDVCQFPPLRVQFAAPPSASSLFQGQKRLKLVTHCRESAAFQQHVLLEYAAYRMYNILTPASFRVRLAQVDYVEANGRLKASRVGYFIEDTDDLARRNGLREAKVPDRIPAAQLSPRDAARVALFEYMIGNLDWSMRAGPAGEGCCHNSRLIVAAGSTALVPVPYDFDYSGLVNAPYAAPPEGFKVDSVRERSYQGYCRLNGEAVAAAAEFRALRPSFDGLFNQIPGMTERTRNKARAYLAEFYGQIATDAILQDKVLKRCL